MMMETWIELGDGEDMTESGRMLSRIGANKISIGCFHSSPSYSQTVQLENRMGNCAMETSDGACTGNVYEPSAMDHDDDERRYNT